MDDTSRKIIDVTMSLIRDKGFVATTTKDIAKLAGKYLSGDFSGCCLGIEAINISER